MLSWFSKFKFQCQHISILYNLLNIVKGAERAFIPALKGEVFSPAIL
jgi:hypothetical protein